MNNIHLHLVRNLPCQAIYGSHQVNLSKSSLVSNVDHKTGCSERATMVNILLLQRPRDLAVPSTWVEYDCLVPCECLTLHNGLSCMYTKSLNSHAQQFTSLALHGASMCTRGGNSSHMVPPLSRSLTQVSTHQSCDGRGFDSHLSPEMFSFQIYLGTSLYTSVLGLKCQPFHF